MERGPLTGCSKDTSSMCQQLGSVPMSCSLEVTIMKYLREKIHRETYSLNLSSRVFIISTVDMDFECCRLDFHSFSVSMRPSFML